MGDSTVAPRRWFLLVLGFVACVTWSCVRADRADPEATARYVRQFISTIESRVVPPEVTKLKTDSTGSRGCSIDRRWSFVTPWSRARYLSWVKTQLSPSYGAALESPDQLTFSRYERGDTQSVVVETAQAGGSVQVTVRLCVLPD